MTTRRRRAVLPVIGLPFTGLLVTGTLLAGCALSGGQPGAARPESPALVGSANRAAADASFAVPPPGRMRGSVQSADLLVSGREPLPRPLLARIAALDGVDATVTLGLAAAPVAGRTVTLGAVDPASYRRFTPEAAARSDAVWQRVAEGDLALAPDLADDLRQRLGTDLVLGNQAGALALRVGARASMAPLVDAVVNHRRGAQLGMLRDNAVLVSLTATADPGDVERALRRLTGGSAAVTVLADATGSEGQRTAFLAGGSVAAAVGSFRYRYFADGSVAPDPGWVAANLRTEEVPLLGRVTCHRVMLPQLRGALEDVVAQGLAESIDAADFGGCYAPRFIGSDPAKGLSLHTWGIAVDLNVQGNHRGTAGEIDRRVVDVFKRWGFAWGGDWAFTDPMHFELAALTRPQRG